MKFKVVPKSASVEAIDSGVAFALNVTLSNEYRWSDYMRDLYASMVKAAPDTGMVAVRLDVLQRIYNANRISKDDWDHVLEALSAGV